MDFLDKYNKKQSITSLELLEQINFFREKEGKPKTNHADLLIIIETEFTNINRKRVKRGVCPEVHTQIKEQLQTEGILISEYINSQNNQTYPMYILPTEKAKQCLLKESKFVRRAVIHYLEILEERIGNTSLKNEREKLFLELKKPLESIKNIFGIKNYDDISYEQLLDLKQTIDKNFNSNEEDKEKALTQSAIEAYYIFRLDDEKNNRALIKTDYFLKEIEKYIHLRPMNLYIVKIEEIIKNNKNYPL